MYGDFFETLKVAVSTHAGKRGEGKGKRKGKSRGVRFEEEIDEIEEEEGDDDVDDSRDVISRLKGDLFDDEEEEQEEQGTSFAAIPAPTHSAALSTHERRQAALAKQIAELEQEAIGPKEWTLLGEASSRARPENSLLEEDLDFEQVGKVIPVITEDTVKTLEEMIKARIRDVRYG